MKLWILRPVENLPESGNPWVPWYDKAFGFVVRAETEDVARALAHAGAGDENYAEKEGASQPWMNAKYSTCVELTADGESSVVMRDFAAA